MPRQIQKKPTADGSSVFAIVPPGQTDADWLTEKGDCLLLRIRVQPGAKKNEIILQDGRLRVRLLAPAVEGKANKALIKFLASVLSTKKSQIELVKGHKSREKTVAVCSLGRNEVLQRLSGDR